jgi:hypothetical protein
LRALGTLLDLLVGVGRQQEAAAAPARGDLLGRCLPGSDEKEVGMVGAKPGRGALGGAVAFLDPARAVQAASVLDGYGSVIALFDEEEGGCESGERTVCASAC